MIMTYVNAFLSSSGAEYNGAMIGRIHYVQLHTVFHAANN